MFPMKYMHGVQAAMDYLHNEICLETHCCMVTKLFSAGSSFLVLLWFPKLSECGLLRVFLLCGLPGVPLLVNVTCLTAANQAEHAVMKMFT